MLKVMQLRPQVQQKRTQQLRVLQIRGSTGRWARYFRKIFLCFYTVWAMKLPIFWAASFCISLVTWV